MIMNRKDCYFTLLGPGWSDEEILEIAAHIGPIIVRENKTERFQFGNQLLCQVTVVQDPNLLEMAENNCPKQTKTDCLTVLLLDKNTATNLDWSNLDVI